MEELNLGVFAQLSRLGVRQVTLTAEASDKFCASLKGFFRPDLPVPEWAQDPNVLGEMVGIRFFREPADG